ncbi:MAG: penicillin acylase family protein [bacterium]
MGKQTHLKILKYVGISLVVVIAGLIVGVYAYLQWTLPKMKGRTELKGLIAQVDVIRDKWGVPHIFAQNKKDLFYALGYVTAQDRLFQMDLMRRVGSGKLAEILGEDLAATDHFFRILSVMWPGERINKMLKGQYREATEAYAAGVNEFIETHQKSLPIEFRILGYAPEPWKMNDGTYIHLYMGWALQTGWSGDLTLMKLVEKLGQEMADEAMPPYPGDGPTIMPEGIRSFAQFFQSLHPSHNLAEKMLLSCETLTGSNGWTISGKKMSGGMPILANDPHLDLSAPSVWYEVHIQANDLDVAGVTLPGISAVVIGNNRNIAWGLTNVMLDDMDFYIEKINPDNPYQYLYKGKWEDMKVVEAVIKVKGKEPLTKEIRITRHGPIVSEIHPGLKEVLAMRWTLNDDLGGTECFMDVNTAKNWEDFKDAVRHYHGPAQNIVYADEGGNIGYYLCGRIPIRANKNEGSLPMPGWDGAHEWKGYVPFEQNPHLYNPEAGFVVTANNKTVPDDYPYYISRYFFPKYRAERITQLIQGKEKLSLDDNKQIQTDIYSIEAEEVTPIILKVLEGQDLDSEGRRALEHLRTWDFFTSDTSVAATLFHVTQMKLIKNIFEDELGEELYREYITTWPSVIKAFRVIMAKADSRWFDDVSTPDEKEGRDDIVRKSIQEAVQELKAKLGKNMRKWHWGRLHRHFSGHPVFRDVRFLKHFFNIGPFPIGGSPSTVALAAYSFTQPYVSSFGVSARQIINFSDRANDVRVINSGCSGQFNSKFYRNQSELWRNAEYHPVLMSRHDVEQNAVATLALLPEGRPE